MNTARGASMWALLAFLSCGLFPARGIAQEAQAAKKPSSHFTSEQLEQIVAPIALYPDPLLMQICMGATYPLEIVEATRWAQANPGQTGQVLEAALKQQQWDPSVKSLCGFPDLLKRMNDNLNWTQDLGDAFMGQQGPLLDAVQRMRHQAYDVGQLKTTSEQTVTVQADQMVVIQPADPQVIYVPTYSPTMVYGGWGYPTWYYPALYAPPSAGAMAFSFGVGVACGAAVWGGCNWAWGHSEVNVNVNNYNTFVKNTDIDASRNVIQNNAGDRADWSHDPAHRGAVNYRDGNTAQYFGGDQGMSRVNADQARGYAPAAGQLASPSGDWSGLNRSGAGQLSVGGDASRFSGQSSGAFSGAWNPSLDSAASMRGGMSLGGGGWGGGGFGRRR